MFPGIVFVCRPERFFAYLHRFPGSHDPTLHAFSDPRLVCTLFTIYLTPTPYISDAFTAH